MKQLKRQIFTLILSMCLLLLSGMTAFASGEGNIDGGGGGMGSEDGGGGLSPGLCWGGG